MKTSIKLAHDIMQIYSAKCKPLCREIGMPQTAFDILMFLSNNPECNTARDIVEVRNIKANLVSVNVEKLVKEGYLNRAQSPGDRRKTLLHCTDKAQMIVEKGRQLQADFVEELFQNVDEQLRNRFFQVMRILESNLKDMQEGRN